MDRLSDFRPIAALTLPGLGDVDPRGLVLVVGPNSSGKSQLLQDLYRSLTGEGRKLVVASHLQIGKPDLDCLLRCLENEGLLSRITDDSGNYQLRPQTTFLGSGSPAPQISSSQPQDWFRSFQPDGSSSHHRRSEFLAYFGRLLVAGLFLERRLTAMATVGAFDFEQGPPQHDVQALYVNDEARKQLFDEILSTFGKGIWVDASKGGQICLRLSDDGTLPSPEERLSPRRMATYRTIESEGDGLKSYVATCVPLLLGRRPICLIDEPEMCLHPPQAYSLGRFIGRFGTSVDSCTFVATHSSHVLRGAIQTAQHIQIIRMTRRDGVFRAHRVDASSLASALEKPTVRAEAVLDGIFAQGVVILEADTDRVVYQSVWETLQAELGLDVHFTTVGGTGGIGDTARLYRTLRIPVAVIADLDLLFDAPKLESIIRMFAPQDQTERLLSVASTIGDRILRMPPSISGDEVKAQLADLLAGSFNWEAGDDRSVRKRLRRLGNDLDRMRRLKSNGVAGLPSDIHSSAVELLADLNSVGVFLVPVGELEGWIGSEGLTASKSNKSAWANEAAQTIARTGAKGGDVWDFMRSVGRFLRS